MPNVKMNRRRTDPGRAAAAALGGFYGRIVPDRPVEKCSECGRPVYSFQKDGKCLRCHLGLSEAEPATAESGPF